MAPAETEPHCPKCGYSLRGLETTGTCPECGQPFDKRQLAQRVEPDQPLTRRRLDRADLVLAAIIGVAMLVIVVVAALLTPGSLY